MTNTTTPEAQARAMADTKAFVDNWHKAWRDRDGQAYAELLHEDAVLYIPRGTMTRETVPQFIEGLLAVWPDHRIAATGWAATSEGELVHVIFERVATGTLPGRLDRAARRRPPYPAGRQGDRGRGLLRPATGLERQ